MKLKGNLTFLIGVVFVMLVFVSVTMTGCAVAKKQHTTHEDEAQPPQPGQPDQPTKVRRK